MAYKSIMAMQLIDKVTPAYKAMGKSATKFSMVQSAALSSANNSMKNMMASAKGYVVGRGVVGGFNMMRENIRGMAQEWVEFDENTHFAASKWNEVKNRTLSFNDALLETKRISRDVGAATRFTAGDVGAAMDVMAMANKTLKESDVSTMTTMAKFATVGRVDDMAESTELLIGAMDAFELKTNMIGSVTDMMAVAFTGANMDLIQLAEGAKRAGGAFFDAQQDMQTFNALAMELAPVYQGEEAGVKLRNIVARMLKPKHYKALKGMGVELFNADKTKFRNVIDVMEDVEVKLRSLNAEKRALRFGEIFNLRDKGAAGKILSGISSGSLRKNYNDQFNALGALDSQYKRIEGSVASLGMILKSTVTNKIFGSAETVRSPLANMLSDMIEKVKNFDMTKINKWLAVNIPRAISLLGDAFKTLWPDIKDTVAVLGGMITKAIKMAPVLLPILDAIIPLTLAFLGLDLAVKGVFSAMLLFDSLKWLGALALANPWVALGVAIAAVVGYLLLVGENWERIKKSFMDYGIRGAIAEIATILQETFIDVMVKAFDTIKGFFKLFGKHIGIEVDDKKSIMVAAGANPFGSNAKPVYDGSERLDGRKTIMRDADKISGSSFFERDLPVVVKYEDKGPVRNFEVISKDFNIPTDGGLQSMVKGSQDPFRNGSLTPPNQAQVQSDVKQKTEISLRLEGMNASLVKEAIIDGKSFSGVELGEQSTGEAS